MEAGCQADCADSRVTSRESELEICLSSISCKLFRLRPAILLQLHQEELVRSERPVEFRLTFDTFFCLNPAERVTENERLVLVNFLLLLHRNLLLPSCALCGYEIRPREAQTSFR